jgi:hypothetical protein
MSCAPNEVTATEEQLVDVLFGERPAAEVRWVKAEHEIYAAECQCGESDCDPPRIRFFKNLIAHPVHIAQVAGRDP